MPLSQDFVNSRLEYLQSSLKNDKVVASQFYPRFQMQYNEMFPFVEGSIAKIQNPQQPVVSSALTKPTLDVATENLKSYLIPYVGEKTNEVIYSLTDAQIFYYEENFEEIQKELLKRIKIPTSIDRYLDNLKMVFANDKNRSNLSVLDTTTPATRPPINFSYASPSFPSSRRYIKKERTTPKSYEMSSDEDTLNRIRPRYVSSYLNTKIKSELQEDLNENFNKLRTGNRSDSLFDRTWMKNFGTNPMRNDTLDTPLPKVTKLKPIESRQRRTPKSDKVFVQQVAFGIKPTRFLGRGVQSREIKHKKEFHKYAVDLKKLHHNVLALKYLKNANNVATFKPIEISDNFKEIIEKFLYDGEKIDTTDFDSLTHTEKRILKRMNSFLKLDFDFDYDDHFQDRFQVMYGSFLAGNDNHELKRELKEYVKLAAHENIISQKEAHQMLQKLDK